MNSYGYQPARVESTDEAIREAVGVVLFFFFLIGVFMGFSLASGPWYNMIIVALVGILGMTFAIRIITGVWPISIQVRIRFNFDEM